MIQGPAPVKAMQLLESLHLFSTVFSLPSQAFDSSFAKSCIVSMEAAWCLSTALGLSLDKESSRMLLMSSLLLPLRHLQVGIYKYRYMRRTHHISLSVHPGACIEGEIDPSNNICDQGEY